MADSKVQPPLDIEELLHELTNKMERVKQLYEQYFMGIEKIEPLTARKEVQRTMLMLQQLHIRNTGLRFKFNTMLQKWNIYITYWNRILREIENGTYARHVVKAQRAAEREGKTLPDEMRIKNRPASGTFDTGAKPEKHFLDMDSDAHLTALPADEGRTAKVDDGTDPGFERVPASGPLPMFAAPSPAPEAARRANSSLTPLPPPTPPPRPPATPPRPLPQVPGISEQELRALHQKYLQTRRLSGESQNVSFETLVNSVAKQVGKVLEQPGIAGVRFDVALQNGKTILKAIPQRKK